MTDDTNTQLGQDLLKAQLELQQYLQSGASTQNGDKKKKAACAGLVNNKKDKVTSAAERNALLERIRTFHNTGKAGDILSLSKDLSKGDRHAVHELAEELGLVHISSGTEGIDRRMTVSIPLLESNASIPLPERNITGDIPSAEHSEQHNIDTTPVAVDDVDETDGHEPTKSTTPPAFHVLQGDNDDESASEDEKPTTPVEAPITMNPLGLLAKEREQREKDRKAQQNAGTVTGNKTSKKTKNGKKVGSSITLKQRDNKDDNADENIEDDMAFLDAQINKVQNSHGRTVIGKGSNYRTIVNGILLAKPTPVEKKSNPRAASALQAKLKQAENNRKAKPKPKKK
jgi:hypothetical protein